MTDSNPLQGTVQNSPFEELTNMARIALGLSGLVTAVIGFLILIWPGHTAMVVAAMFAIYALIAGIVQAALAIFARRADALRRVGYVVTAILLIVAGIIMLANLRTAAASLAVLLGITVGILWILQGIGSVLSSWGQRSVWAVVFGAISIVAGIVLLTSPAWGGAFLWLMLGISLLVLGLIQIGHAFSIGK
ncbi:Uncharacterized membrane protein HdeD, DUF308 family [Propionibacterium cyclohexanicum]|uniref:Uncharacterized membrane protein HdeD, DUF308 family n=1 Tax=Propionibacterium cyclohexanicum TaxID=64702 RepID=A0A1H9TX78_9ACTN|nr:DUF308 domain-containing protein [Propionibacterium cyclohexanicum]SES01363.1 Uncharacterized membrane protein HdeD, DUF308 family [Propionibacterium cyclohexanicum]